MALIIGWSVPHIYEAIEPAIVAYPAKGELEDLEYARLGAIPGGLKNNHEFASCAVEAARRLPLELEDLLYDPQTSGGLLFTLSHACNGVGA